MAEEKVVKVLAFVYHEEVENPFAPGTQMVQQKVAYRGEKLDTDALRPYDQQRAEEHGVFAESASEIKNLPPGPTIAEASVDKSEMTEEQRQAVEQTEGATGDRQGAIAIPPPPAGSAGGDEIVLDESTPTSELADWIREDRPTIDEVVELAEGNPEFAQKLLDAENQATDNDPRKGVQAGLTAIIERGE